jgi:hypothetical protein
MIVPMPITDPQKGVHTKPRLFGVRAKDHEILNRVVLPDLSEV